MARSSKKTDNNHEQENDNPVKTKKSRFERRLESERSADIESKSRGNLIIIVLSVSFIAIIFGLFSPTNATKAIAPSLNYKFKVDVSIANSEFDAKDLPGAIKSCNGTKSFPNIVGSKIQVSDMSDKILLTTKIPPATDMDWGRCNYQIKLNNQVSGLGDKVKIWATFSFGESEKFIVDIGKTEPHVLALNLNFS